MHVTTLATNHINKRDNNTASDCQHSHHHNWDDPFPRGGGVTRLPLKTRLTHTCVDQKRTHTHRSLVRSAHATRQIKKQQQKFEIRTLPGRGHTRALHVAAALKRGVAQWTRARLILARAAIKRLATQTFAIVTACAATGAVALALWIGTSTCELFFFFFFSFSLTHTHTLTLSLAILPGSSAFQCHQNCQSL